MFHRIYAWYAGILHPVVELLKPVAVWLVGLLGWSLPVWWKDAVVLYFMIGGACSKGGQHLPMREYGKPAAAAGPLRFQSVREPGMLWGLFRFVAWPLVIAWALLNDYADRELLLRGYVGNSVVEIGKIVLGTLIFFALNAGL